MALEPQNRVYAGVVQSDGGLGGTISVESRLTQFITINMGGFVSIPAHYGDSDSREEQGLGVIQSRSLGYLGWRIPHRYRMQRSDGIWWVEPDSPAFLQRMPFEMIVLDRPCWISRTRWLFDV